ncbi:MAG TPA: TIGR03619 family F420-dependent LLM class oxidoreductase [Mycobacteriales bacterium]|jgi:probable F420-dependent oxidoreductase|nr:TIGR03619 family F420-dependent LLM class oxidoreductase [Mycobacteriales bacterium]
MAATLSIGVPNFGGWAGGDWRALIDIARVAEDSGVDRIVVVDHVVMGHHTDAYAWGRFPVPPEAPWLEPLIVLTAMATVTSRIRLSTGILIAPLRPAALLAKQVATLDALSGGRVDLGVGVGWQKEEYDAQGLTFADRGLLLEETIAACRALWTDLPASYEGKTVSFAETFCSPQPMQSRLPVWFGGTLSDRMLRRVVELGDGWIPIMGATADDVRDGAARIAASTDRHIDIQSRAATVVGGDGKPDAVATIAGVPNLVAAGVTDVTVNIAAFAPTIAEAPGALATLGATFREVTA